MTVAIAVAAILFDWIVGVLRWLSAMAFERTDAADHVRAYR